MGPPSKQMGAITAPRIMQWPILKDTKMVHKKIKSDQNKLGP
jgi:hypothetical protein